MDAMSMIGPRKPRPGTAVEPAEDIVALYNEAFDRFRKEALWSFRRLEKPLPAHAMTITRSLRVNGGMEGRRLAERIEKACRALDEVAN